MKNPYFIFLILLFLLTFSLNSQALDKDEIIGTVNGENFYLSDFNRLFNSQRSKLDKLSNKEIKDKLVSFIIDRILVSQEAKAKNIEVSEETIKKRLELIKGKKGGEEAFKKFLEENKATLEDAKDEIKTQMLYKLVEKELANNNDGLKSFISKKRENSNIVVYRDKIFPDTQIVPPQAISHQPQVKQENLVPGSPTDLSTLNIFKTGDLTLENVETSNNPQEEIKELIKKIQERQLTAK